MTNGEVNSVDHISIAMSNLAERRNLRENQKNSELPVLMWVLLVVGGAATIISSCLLGNDNKWLHHCQVLALTFVIAVTLAAIADLARPFEGALAVKSTPFVKTLEIMEGTVVSLVTAHGLGVEFCSLRGEPHDEWQRCKHQNGNGEQKKGVLVTEHGGLPEHLLIGLTDRHLGCLGGRHSACDQHVLHPVHVEGVGDAARDDVGGKRCLMHLRTSREVGGQQGGSCAAAEVTGEVREAGDLVGLALAERRRS